MPNIVRRQKLYLAANVVLCVAVLGGCDLLRKKEGPAPTDIAEIAKRPLTPEETEGLLGQVGENWWYGQGVGSTALNAGAIVAFPPYAAYLLANGILNVSGYEPLEITDALPEEQKEAYDEAYRDFTSGPGRLNAAVAGEEFRTETVAKEKLEPYLQSTKNEHR